jgi:hypothetical protein
MMISANLIFSQSPTRQSSELSEVKVFRLMSARINVNKGSCRKPASAHCRHLRYGWEDIPGSVIVSEEKNHKQACRPDCLDAHIASPIRSSATESGYANRHRESRREPLFDHQP